MAQISGKYTSKTASELTALATLWENARAAILGGGQNMSRPGFTVGRVDIKTVQEELDEVYYAQSLQAGTSVTRTYADMGI